MDLRRRRAESVDRGIAQGLPRATANVAKGSAARLPGPAYASSGRPAARTRKRSDPGLRQGDSSEALIRSARSSIGTAKMFAREMAAAAVLPRRQKRRLHLRGAVLRVETPAVYRLGGG